jgi:formylglycine-generating enzyme required for sulfatase activity
MQSSGYGAYDNWGFRAAVTPRGHECPLTLKLDLGNGIAMEFVYIKPGTFVMGGVRPKGGKYECVELPKHEVTITKGFYLGKYEVTQGQYVALMGGKTDEPNIPISAGEGEAVEFCNKLCEKTGQTARLPTEAEWEFAARAGTTADWFFGDDPAPLGEYAWCGSNSGNKKHPVGQKKPNPWGALRHVRQRL